MSDPVKLHLLTSEGASDITPESGASGWKLSQWMRTRGHPLNTRCGGRGLCDACQIDLVSGTLQRFDTGERVTVSPGEKAVRLRSCEHALVEGESASISVPDKSLMSFEPQVIADFRLEVPIGKAPLWPAADEPPSNADRPAAGPPLAAAIDVGTTTVALLLIDLDSGAVLARSSAFNKQTHLGEDVLTRINLCMNEAGLVDRFQEAIVNETLAPLLTEALAEAEAFPEQVVCLVAAGNATMLHLLVAEDPSSMGVAPFTARFLRHRVERLSSTDFRWPSKQDAVSGNGRAGPAPQPAKRDPALHLLPGAAAYVGADLTAGIVATGIRYHPGSVLLVDVGTTGEILLKHGDQLLGCATAAGPAFEGSKLCNGVRAARGAISHIDVIGIDPLAIQTEIIGETLPAGPDAPARPTPRLKPIGICGSAYIDFLAEGVRTGLLQRVGRFDADLAGDRLIDAACHSKCFRVAEGSGKEPICITEADVASLLQAKAAIAAGIVTLLGRVGLKPEEVDTLYLAGGFGLHVRIPSAIGSGLLPGFREDQVELVGNTSLAGAFMAAMDRTVLDEMQVAADGVELVELNLDPDFEVNYIDQLTLPEPV